MCRQNSFYYENISECSSVLVTPSTANVGTEFYYNDLKYRVIQNYIYYNGYININDGRFSSYWDRVIEESPKFKCRQSTFRCNVVSGHSFYEIASGKTINLDHCTWVIRPSSGVSSVSRRGNDLFGSKGAKTGSFTITYTKSGYKARLLTLSISPN